MQETLPGRAALRRAATCAFGILLGLGSVTGSVRADDTDIYIDPSVPVTDQPMVMFSLDYRPNLMGSPAAAGTEAFFTAAPYNLGTLITTLKTINGNDSLNYFDQLFLALVAVLQGVQGVKVGLMMSHNQDGNQLGYQGQNPASNDRGSNGGVILYGFNSLDNATTLENFKKKLIAVKKMNTGASAADHQYQGAQIFFEFFRYLTGQRVHNGHNGYFDYEQGNNKDSTTNMRCGHADPTISPACYDTNIEVPEAPGQPKTQPVRYISPFHTAGACAKVFTINFLFQVSNQDNDSNATIGQARADGGFGFTPSNNNALNDVLAFLRDTDLAEDPDLDADTDGEAFGTPNSQPELAGRQNVTSFFVSNNSNVTTNGYAVAGGTDAVVVLGSSPQAMIDTLTNVFNQILSVSTTFVAASVPVNVFNRAEIVDNVYFALFQAEDDPRWKGNLKKLKLATENVTDVNGNVVGRRFRIVDALAQDAIGAADGRIVPNALTLWSDNSGTRMAVGDSNGDGIVDAKDTNNNGVADNVDPDTGQVTFPVPSTGTAANPPDYVTGRDGRHIPRGGAGQKTPGFRSGSPGDSNPADANAPPEGGPRRIFYLTSTASAASLQPLNVSALSAEIKTQLGNPSLTDAEAQKLIRYARGQDAGDHNANCAATDTSPTSTCRTEARYWLLGDPLHSRPLPINYGADAATGVAYNLGHRNKKNPAIFIAMASNDGHLRFFRNTGGTTADADVPAELGTEVWSFIPPEGMAVQSRLLNNSTPVGESPHPYSFDGEATALIIDQDGDGVVECDGACDGAATDDRVILFIGLRRGGSAYYALDITEPLAPKFLWRISPTARTTTAGTTATTDFAEMAQTFSRPRIARLNLGVTDQGGGVFVTRHRLAIMFGGGYDGGYAASGGQTVRLGKDRDGALADDTKGNAIYAIRANDASLIWKAVGGTGTNTSTVFYHSDLRDSIPSNLTVIDSDADGAHDRVYVGDTGGNVWRVDMPPDQDGTTNPTQAQTTDDWTLTRLACLGRHSAGSAGGGCTNPADSLTPSASALLMDHRFFHEPDVVQARDDNGNRFDAVVIGSGDRENPLDQGPNGTTIDVDNWFYTIKDGNIGVGTGANSTRNHHDLTDITNQCIAGASGCTIGSHGWRLALDNPNGEKALSAPITIDNNIFFTTYLPPGAASNTCGPGEGGGFLYALKLATGAPARNYNAADGPANPDGSGTTDSDRQKDLETPGIPAQVVYLGTPPGGGGSSGACTVNILAGARILEAPGCPRFRTFWQREGS
jgi:type IV pilus assembly protein PilY1